MTANLELRQRAGQLMIMGFDGQQLDGRLTAALRTLQPGGVILFARNIADAAQTHALLSACWETVSQPLFLCVDEEGGTVHRLRDLMGPAPAAAEVGSTGRSKFYHQHGRLLGQQARALGFNVDFAPVLDLALEVSRPVLGSRAVSADPAETTGYAREFLSGLRQMRVLGCGKHFPGLGEANLDTHKELPAVHKAWKRLWDEDLFPYRRLWRKLAFVMVAHAAYPAVTGERIPASLSYKWMNDVLRDKIGYRGIILCDDLEMGGVRAAASTEDAAIETLRAGADMYLVCHSEEHVGRAYEAVLRRAERDSKFRQIVDRAAERIVAFKRKSPELRVKTSAPIPKVVERLRRSMARFREEVEAFARRERSGSARRNPERSEGSEAE